MSFAGQDPLEYVLLFAGFWLLFLPLHQCQPVTYFAYRGTYRLFMQGEAATAPEASGPVAAFF